MRKIIIKLKRHPSALDDNEYELTQISNAISVKTHFSIASTNKEYYAGDRMPRFHAENLANYYESIVSPQTP